MLLMAFPCCRDRRDQALKGVAELGLGGCSSHSLDVPHCLQPSRRMAGDKSDPVLCQACDDREQIADPR
jgi:hypothetical protein